MPIDNNDYSKPHYLPSEGDRGFRALCGLAAALGFKDPFHQMINNDGTCVGDLICFLVDNPGAIKAIYDLVDEEYEGELVEIGDDDEETDEEGEEIG